MTPAPYIVIYDIRNKKRLAQIYKTCLSMGFPIQYSVFYFELTQQEQKKLLKELQTIQKANDSVIMYRTEKLENAVNLGAIPSAFFTLGLIT
jgi:CRISPR-associated protein Cas2